ncbi:hypothetical protein, partial [Paenibacillus xylanexedens]|uniref:hypothetical protein n=1 Tax=Paenibacillus xylanexedens TaxID=528191 RepID=UPI003D0257EC
RYGDSCKRSGGDEIESEEAKRAPLSPDFPFKKGIKKIWRQQRSEDRFVTGTSLNCCTPIRKIR